MTEVYLLEKNDIIEESDQFFHYDLKKFVNVSSNMVGKTVQSSRPYIRTKSTRKQKSAKADVK